MTSFALSLSLPLPQCSTLRHPSPFPLHRTLSDSCRGKPPTAQSRASGIGLGARADPHGLSPGRVRPVRASSAKSAPGDRAASAAANGQPPGGRSPLRERAGERLRAVAAVRSGRGAVGSRDPSPAHDIAEARDELAVSILEEEDELIACHRWAAAPQPRLSSQSSC